jgi:5-methylcytosine-specific restriction endonuclease McrA
LSDPESKQERAKRLKAESFKRYYAKHAEERKRKAREYYAKNRAARQAYARAHAEKNHEQVLLSARESYQRNKPARDAANKAWAAANPDKCRAIRARWAEANPEKDRVAKRKWDKSNPEKKRETKRRRRARLAGLPGDGFTRAEWRELVDQLDHRCVYCLGKFDKLCADHITPVASGGADSIENIVPACRRCNTRKQARPVAVMIARIAQVQAAA